MSFTNPVEVRISTRCWDRSYKWSGGSKPTTLPDGREVTELRAEIRSYNSTTEENDIFEPTKKLAVVGFTTALAGFNGQKGAQSIRYYSNEVLDTFNQPLTLYASGANGTETLFKDQMYETFKDKKPTGCKFTVFLYFYDFETKKVNRFEMSGSALGAWFDLDKDNGILHKRWLKILPGEKKTNGSVLFIPPVLEFGDAFTQEEVNEIVNSEAYHGYEKFEKRVAGNQMDTGDFDQTPAVYDGEQSQELPDASTAQSNVTNLENVPF